MEGTSVNKRITIEELQSYLWNSAVLLRTNIDAGAYKQYIFPLLFFKRICDVYDEETAAAQEEYGEDAAEFDERELHTFIVPKGCHWNDVRAVSENVGVAIVEAFRKVENANSDKLQGIFGNGAWTNKNRLPDRLLKDLLEHFSTKTLSIANTVATVSLDRGMSISSKNSRMTAATRRRSFTPTGRSST